MSNATKAADAPGLGDNPNDLATGPIGRPWTFDEKGQGRDGVPNEAYTFAGVTGLAQAPSGLQEPQGATEGNGGAPKRIRPSRAKGAQAADTALVTPEAQASGLQTDGTVEGGTGTLGEQTAVVETAESEGAAAPSPEK